MLILHIHANPMPSTAKKPNEYAMSWPVKFMELIVPIAWCNRPSAKNPEYRTVKQTHVPEATPETALAAMNENGVAATDIHHDAAATNNKPPAIIGVCRPDLSATNPRGTRTSNCVNP